MISEEAGLRSGFLEGPLEGTVKTHESAKGSMKQRLLLFLLSFLSVGSSSAVADPPSNSSSHATKILTAPVSKVPARAPTPVELPRPLTGNIDVNSNSFLVETWINGIPQKEVSKKAVVTGASGLQDGVNKIKIRVSVPPDDPVPPKSSVLSLDIYRTELPSGKGQHFGRRKLFSWRPDNARAGEFSYTFVIKHDDLRSDPEPRHGN